MKLSEIAPGTKIFIPCATCGENRSMTFRNVHTYRRDKKRSCDGCAKRSSLVKGPTTRQVRDPTRRS